MSPYQLVYGMDAIFPTSLGVPVMKLLQEVQIEENDMQRRINQLSIYSKPEKKFMKEHS